MHSYVCARSYISVHAHNFGILLEHYKCMSMPFDFCTFLFPLTALCSVLQTLHLGTPKVGSLMVCVSQSICSVGPCVPFSLVLSILLPIRTVDHVSPSTPARSLLHPITSATVLTCIHATIYVSSYSYICVLVLFILFATACITYRSRWCVVKEKRGRC